MRHRVDPTERLRAVQAATSPTELTATLGDSSPEVVRTAIHRLVEMEGAGAAGALRARLFDVDLLVVADIARALREIGDDGVVEAAIGGLSDPRSTRRLAAVRALSMLGQQAVEPLRHALGDAVGGVRAAALDALTRLEDGIGASAGADCARLVCDPVAHVRVAAVRAVARLVPHPGAMLAPAVRDDDRLVRLAVAEHVARLPEQAARMLLEDRNARVREAAARGAGRREVGALAVLLADDPARDVRRAAAHALGAIRDEHAAALLLPALEDRDALTRAAALHELEHLLSRQGVVRQLCDELANERAERRRAVVYALARLDAREAAADVSRLAADPDPEVRLALIHSAPALFDEPEPLMRYLSEDPDQAVCDAALMWLLRARRSGS